MPYEVRKTAAFEGWLLEIADLLAKGAIFDRIKRVESGLLGDRRNVGDRITELRIDVGQGYRLYCTMRGPAAVLFLWGGTKKSRKKDIRRAEAMVKAMNKEKKAPPAGRVRDRQATYTPGGGEDEFHFTEEELKVSPLDVADYIRGDDETQIYLLRNALASGHAAYIANTLGAVARARGLTNLERATGIKRQTLNKSLSLKGNPTLETLVRVLGALGLRLEIVEDRAKRAAAR